MSPSRLSSQLWFQLIHRNPAPQSISYLIHHFLLTGSQKSSHFRAVWRRILADRNFCWPLKRSVWTKGASLLTVVGMDWMQKSQRHETTQSALCNKCLGVRRNELISSTTLVLTQLWVNISIYSMHWGGPSHSSSWRSRSRIWPFALSEYKVPDFVQEKSRTVSKRSPLFYVPKLVPNGRP